MGRLLAVMIFAFLQVVSIERQSRWNLIQLVTPMYTVSLFLFDLSMKREVMGENERLWGTKRLCGSKKGYGVRAIPIFRSAIFLQQFKHFPSQFQVPPILLAGETILHAHGLAFLEKVLSKPPNLGVVVYRTDGTCKHHSFHLSHSFHFSHYSKEKFQKRTKR